MHKRTAFALLTTAAVLTAACAKKEEPPAAAATTAPAAAAPAAAAKGTAKITGHVKLDGAAPKAEKLKVDADPKCKEMHSTEPLLSEKVVVAEDGSLANVFVWVKEGVSGAYPVPSDPVVMDQAGCQYKPHVFGIRAGQTLKIKNSDPTLHNVHALPKLNEEFNVAMPQTLKEIDRVFEKQEVPVKFKCEVHGWMNAFVGVVDHPYFAVTDAAGNFEIAELPAGSYTIEAIHADKYGAQTAQVTLADAEAKAQDFTFSSSAPAP